MTENLLEMQRYHKFCALPDCLLVKIVITIGGERFQKENRFQSASSVNGNTTQFQGMKSGAGHYSIVNVEIHSLALAGEAYKANVLNATKM